MSALSGEAHAGARAQWPKEWTWVRTEKRGGGCDAGRIDSRGLRQRERLGAVVGAGFPEGEQIQSDGQFFTSR